MWKIASRMVLALLLVSAALPFTTPFSSGSNGSDGAFDIAANDPRVIGGVFTWDPVRDNLDVDGDNVYHFTTINIPAEVTVRILANKTRQTGPIIWLATGIVSVIGNINLSGQDGYPATQNNFAVRTPAIPGPGGYPGGNGSRNGSAPEPGAGPGAAGAQSAAGGDGCPASHVAPPMCTNLAYCSECSTRTAATYGTPLLLPLVGGSGGSGGVSTSDSCFGAGGGAGGGAIRIVSSTEIRLSSSVDCCASTYGSIIANGGAGGAGAYGCASGGAGSGGAIHLQAPLITTTQGDTGLLRGQGGGVLANGGAQTGWSASDGRIRIDSTANTLLTPVNPTPATGPLFPIPIVPAPAIRVISVNGTNAPAIPGGAYTTPDVSVNTSSPIAITVQAANIPTNSTVTLRISSEGNSTVADQLVPVTLNAQLQATANVTFPAGVSRFYIRAIW